jgi:hypothetical protein
MFTTLSSIASTQTNPTKETMINTHSFLDYTVTHQDTIITYHASNMVLILHRDDSYPRKPKACSQAGGHFFMSSNTNNPKNDSAVLNIAQLIKSVMSSVTKAKLGALYVNTCTAISQHQLLEEMGHPQLPTPTQTNNSTALSVITSNIHPRQTKAMDM